MLFDTFSVCKKSFYSTPWKLKLKWTFKLKTIQSTHYLSVSFQFLELFVSEIGKRALWMSLKA